MTLDRQKPVQEFQNAPGAAAMLVSLKAAGTGITLHAADYVFLLDPWWNPAVEAQAVDRVHRIGQTNTVFVYRMVTAGTIEERIQALKASKKDLFDRLVDGLGGDFDLSRHFSSLHSLVQLTAHAEPEESGSRCRAARPPRRVPRSRPPGACRRRSEPRAPARGAAAGRALGRCGSHRRILLGRKDVLLADLVEEAAVAQDLGDIGIASADQEVAAGLPQVVVEVLHRHHCGGVEVPGVFHPQDENADILILGQSADLFLKKVGSAEEQLPLDVDDRNLWVRALGGVGQSPPGSRSR